MPVRSSMAYIITYVRELINDPAGASQKFTDQQIQDRLDTQRLDLYQDCLESADTLTPTGTIEWHDFFSDMGFWETDYVIQRTNGVNPGAPTTAEPLIGKWNWAANQVQPLVITGRVYNVYGVASALLNTMIADERRQITSWTADGTTIQRLGQIRNLQNLSQEYAKRAWGWGRGKYSQVKLVRKDLRN